MVEPKIEKPKEIEKIEKAPKEEKSPVPNQDSANRYWNYAQTTRMIEVPKVAIFSGEGGLIIVPLDRLGRVLLDSTLFLPIETLDKLAEAMSKLADETNKE
jgi:hypothetical protein